MPALPTIATNRSFSASILLSNIPKDDQVSILDKLVASLQATDCTGVDLVASLVVQQGNPEVTVNFITFLESLIRIGNVNDAVRLGLRYPSLGSELLQKAAEAISQAKFINDGQQHDLNAVLSYLSFTRSTISRLPLTEAHSILFRSCLDLLIAENVEIAAASKGVIFILLSATSEIHFASFVLPLQHLIWDCVRKLVSSKTDRVRSLNGFSLWLKWILSAKDFKLGDFVTDHYWQLLNLGLRWGDPEQRKMCLSILKLTAAADTTALSDGARQQFYRYCTVFETIVLGRYINQILECENDLNVLATDSTLSIQWLYTLLASSLDSRMQDSNRKFIGNWVMRSGLTATAEFVQFFQDDFMPWAVQGSLFVSTLKRPQGQLRCTHGDQLSQFLKRLLRKSTRPDKLSDAILERILAKKNSIFPYAIVYLMEGLQGTLRDGQLKEISALKGLPEVARDFVKVRTCHIKNGEINLYGTSRRETLEREAVTKCTTFDADLDSVEELWDDLDYLEYPKRLLMLIPEILLNPRLVRRAVGEPSLAAYLAEKVGILRNISRTKTFLFSPLVDALRKTVLTIDGATEVFGIEDFIISIAEHPSEPTVDLMLEESTIHLTSFTYEHYFGERPTYGIAALLDMLSRMQNSQNVIRQVYNRLLQQWRYQKVPPLTVSPWKTTLQLQVLLLCLEQLATVSAAECQASLEDLLHVLSIEPLPRYRYLLEWMLARLIIRHDMEEVLLQRLASKDHHSNPKHLASLMKIGTILACRQGCDERFVLRLATLFIPLAASSKVVIRHEAQWQIPQLLEHARGKGWTSITENPAFSILEEYIRNQGQFQDPPPERQIGRFDPAADHTFANLVEGSWFGLDFIEAPLTHRAEFLRLYDADVDLDVPKSCMPLGGMVQRPATKDESAAVDITDNSTANPRREEATALQTKGAAYLARAISSPDSQNTRASNIIVVGSLVENPYNLGGLSRVSEIFGASALCLWSQKVISNKDFTSVSVSSHLHLPIVQLSASGVPEYLAEKKSEGYAIVGIEQTDRSLTLGSMDTKLPQKMVLVIGSEREGIPAIVLTECDMLVEIPQHGITRSLNVQTAVSIVLYEHSRQHSGSA